MGHPDTEVLQWRVCEERHPGTGHARGMGRLSYGRPVLDPEFRERSQGQGAELGTLDALLPATRCFSLSLKSGAHAASGLLVLRVEWDLHQVAIQ